VDIIAIKGAHTTINVRNLHSEKNKASSSTALSVIPNIENAGKARRA
jgi:hypothetical protein